MSNKSISFITPAFNCEKTIKESILSIMKVYIPGDECIVVNDCSSDNTELVIKKLADNYPIILINHDKNMGGAGARNTAILNCINEKIFCLDSDNILDKKSFDKLRKYSNIHPKRCLFFEELHYFKTIFGIKIFTHNWIFEKSKYILNDYLNTKIVPGASGNYLFTKESWSKVGGYPKYSGALDTWGFGLYQTIFGFNQYKIPGTFYNHRYGTESYYVRDSKNVLGLEKKRIKIIDKFLFRVPTTHRKIIKKLGVKWYSTLGE